MPNTANLLRNKPSIVEKAYQDHSETQVPTSHRCPPDQSPNTTVVQLSTVEALFVPIYHGVLPRLPWTMTWTILCMLRATRFENTTQGVNETSIS